jgi:hypothetical protein
MRAISRVREGNNRTAVLAVLATILIGIIAAYVLVNGSVKLVLLIPGLALVAAGFYRPEVILWPLMLLNVCFSGTQFALGGASVFQPGAYILDPFRFNISQILILVLFVIVLARWLLGTKLVRLPAPVWIPIVAFLCIYGFQLARALSTGVSYSEAVDPFNGVYVVFGITAFWCFVQVLDTPSKRTRSLDVVFGLATIRALIALYNYAFGAGDVANAYRVVGVKVALWETADHILFTLLIVIALAGWATHRLSRTRAALWLAGSGILVVTIMLSFRRASWFGLIAAIVLTVALLGPRFRRAAALAPVVLAMFAGVVAFAQQRFAGSGSLISRIFSDFAANNGPTRQQEWQLAWQTIMRNPLAGDIAARRAGSSFADWDTRIVHSVPLYAWMKFGILGMLVLALVPVACGWYAWKAVRARCSEEHIAFGVVGQAPIVFFYALTADPLIELRVMMFLAFAGALGLLAWLQREGQPGTTMEMERPADD